MREWQDRGLATVKMELGNALIERVRDVAYGSKFSFTDVWRIRTDYDALEDILNT